MSLTVKYFVISNYFEWSIRATSIGVSIIQFLIITSRTGNHCAYVMGLLRFESDWLMLLITAQLLKVIVFSLWRLKLRDMETEAGEYNISTIMSDRPTLERFSGDQENKGQLTPK